MKSLKNSRFINLFTTTLLVLSCAVAKSQCSVNAGPDATKCLGQPYNPGPFVSTSGTSGTVTYSWNGTTFNPSASTSLAPAATTTYTLTIHDASGCIATDQVVVNILSLPSVNAGSDMSICSGTPTSLCATASSPNGAISLYTWVTGPSAQCWNVAPVTQTTYTVTAVDVAGCQKSDAMTVFIYPLPVVNAGSDQSICLSQGSLQLNGSPAGGTWSGNNVSSSGLFTPTSNGNTTLTYSYVNSNGCPNSDQVVITVTSPSSINGGNDVDLCINDAPITLPNVGNWSGSPLVTNSGTFTPSAAGVYNLTVTNNSAGCSVSDNIVVNVHPKPTVSAGNDANICTGQSVSLSATASSANGSIDNISWSGSSLSNGSSLTPLASPNNTTNYTITVEDNEGCTASDVVTVTVNNFPTVNAGNDVSVCSNASPLQLTGNSPVGGTWSGTGVNASGLFTPTLPGNFSITYTYSSAAGCTSSDQLVVTVIAAGSVNAGNDVTLCLNTTPYQLLSGGTWTGSTWVTSNGLFTPGAVGTYNLNYTATTGSCTASDNVIVFVKSLPTVNAGSDQNICNGQTAQLSATANSVNGTISSYAWSGNVVSNIAIANPTASPTINSNYTLTVTDNLGCTASDAVAINVNQLPVVNAGSDMNTCVNGGAVSLSGFSPNFGTWSGSGVSNAGVFTPSTVGSFTLTYSFTNTNGCSNSDQMIMTVNAAGTVNAGNDMNICIDSSPIQLNPAGTWTGSTLVTSSGVFTPSALGNYTLTFTGISGGCSGTDQMVVSVLSLPVVNAGGDQGVCVGGQASLNGSATSANGIINSYLWTSNQVSNPSSAVATININSNVVLSLQATDAAGCVGSDQITIAANPLPTVNAGSDVSFCDQPITQQLTGFSPSGGTWTGSNVSASGMYTPTNIGSSVLTYCFTDANNCSACDQITVTTNSTTLANAGADESVCQGSAAFNLTPGIPGGSWTATSYLTTSGVFNPTQSGVFTCTYGIGLGSCYNTDTKIVTVNSTPVVSAGADASVCIGSSYVLSGGATGNSPMTYLWDNASLLDDSTAPNPTTSATSSVDFTLFVTDANGCSNSDMTHLEVAALPHASFTAPAQGCVNTPIVLNNTSTNAATYSWSFGNSSISNNNNPNTNYLLDGIYNIVLTATSVAGCTDTYNQDIEIISAPVAAFSTSVLSGCSPLSVQVQNNTTGQYVSYDWDLAGDPYSGINPPTATLTANLIAENHDITLTATNACGTDSETHSVFVNPQPHASFSTNLSSQCSPVTTVFNNSSAGNPQSYLWDLGDGDISNLATPNPKVYITEDASEDFIITLTATNACGVDIYSSSLTVLPNTVDMNLQPSVPAGCSPLFVEFNNMTTGATNFYYDFGDNTSSNLNSPNHIFNDAGVYDIVFYANDGCSFDTTSLSITVVQSPSISIDVQETEACPHVDLHFNSSTQGNISSIQWDFGDNQNASENNPVHAYAIGNNYLISATATDVNGCPATGSLSFDVYPEPIMDLTLSANGGCSPLNICSENNTTGATSYNWNFGNGYISSAQNECVTYTNTTDAIDSYVISLDASNDFGCTNHTEQTITVQPQPVTSFTLMDDESCMLMENISVNVQTQGSISYEWYADGTLVSSASTPNFSFDEVGEHEIHVISYNLQGCTDVASQTYTIHPLPQIDIMPDVFNGCSPLTVTFENTTLNGGTWDWTFGNGTHSSLETPSVILSDPGVYDVQLHATSQYGCESVQFFDDMLEAFVVPQASFTYDPEGEVIYELDIQFMNTSEGAVNYNWSFGDGIFSKENSPSHHFQNGGLFTVTLFATNEFGCTTEAVKQVNIDKTFYFFMPNSFTPDNDGLNDEFIPSFSSLDEIRSYEFVVIDRWGEVVFQTDDPKTGWIGNVKKGEYYTHNDAFIWKVKIEFNNLQTSKTYSGNVTILR